MLRAGDVAVPSGVKPVEEGELDSEALRARDADELPQAADVGLDRHRESEEVDRDEDAYRICVQRGDSYESAR